MNVFIIAALTADGFIAADEGHESTSWTTKADTKYFVEKTKQAGTVVMGRKTFATFNKPLKDRRLIIITSNPQAIQVEGVEATAESPQDLLKRLEAEGVREVAIAGGAQTYYQFMEAGLVDELFLCIVPKFFGIGIRLFSNFLDRDLRLLGSRLLEDDQTVLHQYQVK